MKGLAFVVLLLAVQVAAEYPSYSGYRVFKLGQVDKEQAAFLLAMRSNLLLDFWSAMHVMVHPSMYDEFVSQLSTRKIAFEIVVDDVQKNVEEEQWRQEVAGGAVLDRGNPTRSYLSFDAIKDYLTHISETYPNTAKLASIGTSTEGRPIPIMMVAGNGSREAKHRPLIVVDGGYHGREWIAPAMLIHIVRELATNPKNADLITDLTWHIIPLVNPDGYEYSRNMDRFWVRSRGRTECPDKPNENVGVDLNSNFDFHWQEYEDSEPNALLTATINPCNQAFAGPRPFSELETKSVRSHMMSNEMRTKLYLSFHSCGSGIYYPWSYTSNPVENSVQLQEVARRANRAQMLLSGLRYKVQAASATPFRGTGTSTDWARGVLKIPLTYYIELPGCGRCDIPSFDPPPSTIEPIVTSFFPAVRSFALTVISAKTMLVKQKRSGSFENAAPPIRSSILVAPQCFVMLIAAFKSHHLFMAF